MFRHNDKKALIKKINELQDLESYFYSKIKRRNVKIKVRDLKKQLLLLER